MISISSIPPFVFDLLILLIILVSALLGRRRGFVLTLCGSLALFVALLGAAVLTDLLAPAIGTLVLPIVEEHLGELLAASVGDLYTDAGGIIHATLDQLLPLLDRSPALSGLKDAIVYAVEQGVLDISGNTLRAVAAYVSEQFTRLILFPVFFLLIMLIWGALSRLLDLAFRLPGLNFLNRTAGLLLGILRGVVLVFALCWLFKDSYLSRSIINGSFLLPYFCDGVIFSAFSLPNL